MSEEKQKVSRDPAHKYFSQILHMADDELDPFDYRLFGHYIRKANAGDTVQEAIRETARITQMSVAKVRSSRRSLKNKRYIDFSEPTPKQIKSGEAVEITIIDRWADNIERYSKKSTPVSDSARVSERVPVSDSARPPVSDSAQILEERVIEEKENKKYIPPKSAGVASFNETESVDGSEGDSTANIKEQPALAKKISGIYPNMTPLSKEWIRFLRVQPDLIALYDEEPDFRDFIDPFIESQKTKLNGLPFKRDKVMPAIRLKFETDWLEYQRVRHPVQPNVSSEDLMGGII